MSFAKLISHRKPVASWWTVEKEGGGVMWISQGSPAAGFHKQAQDRCFYASSVGGRRDLRLILDPLSPSRGRSVLREYLYGNLSLPESCVGLEHEVKFVGF